MNVFVRKSLAASEWDSIQVRKLQNGTVSKFELKGRVYKYEKSDSVCHGIQHENFRTVQYQGVKTHLMGQNVKIV